MHNQVLKIIKQMDNSLLAVRNINHKYIVVGREFPMESTLSDKKKKKHITLGILAMWMQAKRRCQRVFFI